MVTIDFETDAIVENPLLKPPRPVGVALDVPGQTSKYLAWGHPTENNCSFADACDALDHASRIAAKEGGFIFHNAPFDLSVWGSMHPYFKTLIRGIPWKFIHDTLYLIFLADPYSKTLSLKPSAERWLGLPPTEQTLLKNWILANVPGATDTKFGEFISRAPGSLVGQYAVGDISRTRLLFNKLHPMIVEQGMEEAYDRERRLMPVLVEATRRGIRVDRERLEADTEAHTKTLDKCEETLATRIDATPAIFEDEEVFKDALERSGAVKEWVLTPKDKKRSLAAGNLKILIPEVAELMTYRAAVKGCLQTFMRPWVAFSREDGRLHPNWNQVRQAKGAWNVKGTRTGRLSSDEPSFMNVTTEFESQDGSPYVVPEGMLLYPVLRRYCLPEEFHLWLKRDFSSQEFRILAHFEDGTLAEAYRANPDLDPHQMGVEMFRELLGLVISRKPVKITGFSIVYGTGYTGLSIQLGRPLEDARTIKDAYLSVFPGVKTLMEDVQTRGACGMAIRTWGGRIYYSEPPKMVKKTDAWGNTFERKQDFHYKLLNYLIQGSAADQTKESICDWAENRDPDALFLATVHDENNISAPKENWERHMATLRESMERPRFDVPFRTEGLYGPNWADLEKCK
jgi:DNA polymerase-1